MMLVNSGMDIRKFSVTIAIAPCFSFGKMYFEEDGAIAQRVDSSYVTTGDTIAGWAN